MEILNKFLIIQTAFIGDCILTLPFIQELNKNNPGSVIDVVCTPAAEEIFVSSPYVNTVIVYDKRKSGKSVKAAMKFGGELKQGNYSRVYTLHKSMRSAIITYYTGAEETYGFSNSAFPAVFRHIINYDHTAHEVKRLLSFTGSNYNGVSWKIMPEIKVPDDGVKRVEDFILSAGRFAVIAPSSVWETKRYPEERFREIAGYLVSLGLKVILTGGKGDRELCEQVKAGNEEVLNAAGVFSLTESVYLISRSEILITNDSAPTHMAMAAGAPVITIYCSTVPEFGFAGYSDKSRSIGVKDLRCHPCGIHGYKECPAGHFRCGHDLDAGDVIKLAEEILNAEKK